MATSSRDHSSVQYATVASFIWLKEIIILAKEEQSNLLGQKISLTHEVHLNYSLPHSSKLLLQEHTRSPKTALAILVTIVV
jgi:hypothetical protein